MKNKLSQLREPVNGLTHLIAAGASLFGLIDSTNNRLG